MNPSNTPASPWAIASAKRASLLRWARKADAYDNALAESFFGTLECELLDRVRFQTREEARLALFEWLETWYNRRRRHSSLGMLAPLEFERRWQQEAALT